MQDNPTTYTPTADKLVSIIADTFHIRKRAIWPDTRWEQIGISPAGKDQILTKLQNEFMVEIPAADRRSINTIWDALKYIESHDSWRKTGKVPNA